MLKNIFPYFDSRVHPDKKKKKKKRNPYVKFQDMATQSLVKNNPILLKLLEYFIIELETSAFGQR